MYETPRLAQMRDCLNRHLLRKLIGRDQPIDDILVNVGSKSINNNGDEDGADFKS